MTEISFNGPIGGHNVLAGINVPGGTFNANFHSSRRDEDDQCLRDLRTTDPRHDKYRIEETNGGLLQGAFLFKAHVGTSISTHGIWSSVTSPDGMLLAVASGNNAVKIWDISVSPSRQIPKDHDDPITAIVFSPDGTKLAIATEYGPIKIWDPTTGSCLKRLAVPKAKINSMAFFPDGKRLASGSNAIEIWDAISGVCLEAVHLDNKLFSGLVASIAASSNGAIVAVALSGEQVIDIWDLTTVARLRRVVYYNGGSSVSAAGVVVFSSDGTRLAVAPPTGAVYIWDVNTGKCLQILENFFKPWLFSHDGSSPFRYDLHVFDLQALVNGLLKKQDSISRLRLSGFDICPKRTWILRRQEPVLWLPLEYRPSAMAVYDGCVVIVCKSGQLLFFQFDVDTLDMELGLESGSS
ncbi:Vegetative incompatibility protein HET-E-1 [Cladobotryum mycophilum]|uniref:Vegetative incompatibility protein HET-E-1 n=1 Tax=Cladobotryum mycophilum TaxID=491253 RepID=A0ABR0T0P0_9HYPO